MAYISKKIRQQVRNKFGGRCAYTGYPLHIDWQVDHIIPVCDNYYKGVYYNTINNIDNMVPALKIVNHYKRGKNLEEFREYMLTFHLRLSRLPKKTTVNATKMRIIYMNTIADLFDISVDKPFGGIFYFETFNKQTL